MVKMREPYSGIVVSVVPEKVSVRLSKGYVLLDDEVVCDEEADGNEVDQEDEADDEDEDVPDESSTITEIKEYAKEKGIKLKSRKKEEMIEELKEA